jgi:hypothetical protein
MQALAEALRLQNLTLAYEGLRPTVGEHFGVPSPLGRVTHLARIAPEPELAIQMILRRGSCVS